jgi:large subunit ribosomal protein L3
MNIGILGYKINMTQIFNKDGILLPVTPFFCGPCFITQLKTKDKEGYNSIQIGYMELLKQNKRKTKPLLGHFSRKNLPYLKYLKEYKLINNNYTIGDKITVNIFKIGQKVKITALTIGKGFSGNIKRNHFHRGPMSHGSKHHRLQGSIGAGTTPGRVIPGKKMSGHLGSKKATILNLEIININAVDNLLLIKGSTPGKNGSFSNIKL